MSVDFNFPTAEVPEVLLYLKKEQTYSLVHECLENAVSLLKECPTCKSLRTCAGEKSQVRIKALE